MLLVHANGRCRKADDRDNTVPIKPDRSTETDSASNGLFSIPGNALLADLFKLGEQLLAIRGTWLFQSSGPETYVPVAKCTAPPFPFAQESIAR